MISGGVLKIFRTPVTWMVYSSKWLRLDDLRVPHYKKPPYNPHVGILRVVSHHGCVHQLPAVGSSSRIRWHGALSNHSHVVRLDSWWQHESGHETDLMCMNYINGFNQIEDLKVSDLPKAFVLVTAANSTASRVHFFYTLLGSHMPCSMHVYKSMPNPPDLFCINLSANQLAFHQQTHANSSPRKALPTIRLLPHTSRWDMNNY